MRDLPRERFALVAEATYYFVAGLWPVLHYSSFERVSGPKQDDWLVKTLGLLLLPIAAALVLGARQPAPREVRVLALGSALVLALCDVVFVVQRRVRAVYLFDAATEVALAAGLVLGRRADSRRARERTAVLTWPD